MTERWKYVERLGYLTGAHRRTLEALNGVQTLSLRALCLGLIDEAECGTSDIRARSERINEAVRLIRDIYMTSRTGEEIVDAVLRRKEKARKGYENSANRGDTGDCEPTQGGAEGS